MQRRCRGFSHVPAAPPGRLRNIADLFCGRQARREKRNGYHRRICAAEIDSERQLADLFGRIAALDRLCEFIACGGTCPYSRCTGGNPAGLADLAERQGILDNLCPKDGIECIQGGCRRLRLPRMQQPDGERLALFVQGNQMGFVRSNEPLGNFRLKADRAWVAPLWPAALGRESLY